MPAWKNTVGLAPPRNHSWATAQWLVGRHPALARLVERVPGCVAIADPDPPWVDVDTLADAVRDLDAHRRAWKEYEARRPAPDDDAKWDAWQAAGPVPSPQVQALAVMSRTEMSRLRLLATWGPGRVELAVDDLGGLDAAGQRLIADWCLAVQTEHAHLIWNVRH